MWSNCTTYNTFALETKQTLDACITMGGNVPPILLQSEPMFTLSTEKYTQRSQVNLKFLLLILFSALGRWQFRVTKCIFSKFYTWLLSNTVNDGENHKMNVMLTQKCRHLSQKSRHLSQKIIVTSKQTIKILNWPIFCNGV